MITDHDSPPLYPASGPSLACKVLQSASATASRHRRHALVPRQCHSMDPLARALAEASRLYAAIAGGGGGAAGAAGINAGGVGAEGVSRKPHRVAGGGA